MDQITISKKFYIGFLLLISIVGPSSFAAPDFKQPGTASGTRKRLPSLNDTKKLTEPIQLPGLPAMDASTKFLDGYMTHPHNGATLYQMRFSSTKDTEALINFYKENFNSKHWKISKLTASSLRAEDSTRHLCIINARDTDSPDETNISLFNITYQMITSSR